MRYVAAFGVSMAALALGGVAPAAAPRPSLLSSFRLGQGTGALCQMQARTVDPALRSMFDRAFSIVCRDAATPVGRLYALRTGADDPLARVAALRAGAIRCGPATGTTLADVGNVRAADCTSAAANIRYRSYSVTRGNTVYVAEGLGAYDSALELALRTIVTDRFVPGEVTIAQTAIPDRAAFARVQAGSLDLQTALQEGYRRNNSGAYVEAAEFFDTLLQRTDGSSRQRFGEYLANRGLQKSNLGEFAEADALFAQARALPTSDPVQLRLRRNLEALNLVNQRRFDAAIALLAKPVVADERIVKPLDNQIDPDSAAALSDANPLARPLGSEESGGLTAPEKAQILDAQALQIRGTALRLKGDLPAAKAALDGALAGLAAVRDGRVVSTIRLRTQAMGELSAIAEAGGDYPTAERLLREGLVLVEGQYPGSVAINAARARLAAYLTRRGQTLPALVLYRTIVTDMGATGGSTVGFANLLAPYFALLVRQIPTQPALVNDFFEATQTLVRPGVADTQAVLARELSGGSDEAGRLFRQSINLSREVERQRVELARLAAIDQPTPDVVAQIARTRAAVDTLAQDQVVTQSQLSAFPRYAAISTRALTLPELQKVLKADEAYLKIALVADRIYGVFATADGATAYAATIGATELDRKVDALRDTIAKEEKGELLTFPFDVKLAHDLYVGLAGPVTGQLARVKHLVFEPDGGMLRLPPALFVTDQASVDRYAARAAAPKGDPFDFRDVAFLARTMDISTAVSARGFRDVRLSRPSAARREYLGLGENAPVSPLAQLTSTRSVSGGDAIDCTWPLEAWSNPIKPTELYSAEKVIGANESAIVTGADFTDTAIKARRDLTNYRILHFATHGLV
ncbi:MAG: CHAT domain-containing protein, partial [Sphingomonas sp.]